MPLTLDAQAYSLDAVEDWIAGDSHTFRFTVTLSDGSAKDISNDELRWALVERAYHNRADAVLTDEDTAVEIVTSGSVDPTQGEFEVRVDEGATDENWGQHTQRVTVDPLTESQQTWVGGVLLTA